MLLKDFEFAEEAFGYELNNTEYMITGDENDALNILGINLEFIKENGLEEIWSNCKNKIKELGG